MSCPISPISAFQSTNLNSKIDCFGRLGDRIVRALGAPLVSVEIHQDQLFENISIACEMYTKFAGYTREYLVFDSLMYQKGKGIRLDYLYTLANTDLDLTHKVNHSTPSESTSSYLKVPDQVYIVTHALTGAAFQTDTYLSAYFGSGLNKNQIFDVGTYNLLLSTVTLETFYTESSSVYTTLTSFNMTVSEIPPTVFADSPTLSSLYGSGISAGQIFTSAEYSLLTAVNRYPLSAFFVDLGIGMYGPLVPLSSSLFVNNTHLSADYPNGIDINATLLSAEYINLSTFFDTNLSAFYTTEVLSTVHVDPTFVIKYDLPEELVLNTALSAYSEGIEAGTVLSASEFSILSTYSYYPISGYFVESYSHASKTCEVVEKDNNQNFNNMFDYDIMDYRKVIAITDFEEGYSSGINTLFTIEQTLAQQTYFSYAMGNYGFDLISWYCVKNWLETREKVLATKRTVDFNEYTQYARFYPEPSSTSRFYGLLACYVELPLKNIISNPWVYQYALALCKISVGMVRGKYGAVQMFGGQIFSQDLLQQGLTEKAALEQKLYEGSAAGFGDGEFSGFFIG